jgi:hypothetical protein
VLFSAVGNVANDLAVIPVISLAQRKTTAEAAIQQLRHFTQEELSGIDRLTTDSLGTLSAFLLIPHLAEEHALHTLLHENGYDYAAAGLMPLVMGEHAGAFQMLGWLTFVLGPAQSNAKTRKLFTDGKRYGQLDFEARQNANSRNYMCASLTPVIIYVAGAKKGLAAHYFDRFDAKYGPLEAARLAGVLVWWVKHYGKAGLAWGKAFQGLEIEIKRFGYTVPKEGNFKCYTKPPTGAPVSAENEYAKFKKEVQPLDWANSGRWAREIAMAWANLRNGT